MSDRKEISIYDLGSGGISILEAEIVRLQAEIAELRTGLAAERAALGAITIRVELFAGQLDEWGYHEAASELRREILGGPVVLHGNYAALVTELEAARDADRSTLADLLNAIAAYDKARAE